MSEILVVAEHIDGRPVPGVYELMSLAREINQSDEGKIRILLPGNGVNEIAGEIASVSGYDVVVLENEQLELYNGEHYKNAVSQFAKKAAPDFIITLHSSRGMEYAPGLARRLNGCCISAIEGVCKDGGRISFTRAVFGGKMETVLIPDEGLTGPVVLTAMPGSWKRCEKPDETGAVFIERFEIDDARSRTLKLSEPDTFERDISDADVIVAAGRGVGKMENISLVEKMAALFPGAAIAGSRPVCDSGWLEYKRQVGITGASVMPKLYIACGISGARQHTAGMRNSGFIVSISTDPTAAIFNISDVNIVADLKDFIPAFIEAYHASERD